MEAGHLFERLEIQLNMMARSSEVRQGWSSPHEQGGGGRGGMG